MAESPYKYRTAPAAIHIINVHGYGDSFSEPEVFAVIEYPHWTQRDYRFLALMLELAESGWDELILDELKTDNSRFDKERFEEFRSDVRHCIDQYQMRKEGKI